MGGALQSESGSWAFFETMAEPLAIPLLRMAVALLKEVENFGVRE